MRYGSVLSSRLLRRKRMGSDFGVRIGKLWTYGGIVCIPWDAKCRSDKKAYAEANYKFKSNLFSKSNADKFSDTKAIKITDTTANT